jgi:hypothetical protein
MTTKPKGRCPRHWTAAQRLDRYTKVDPRSGCHLWQASIKPNGYGQLTFRMQRMMAHRLAWIARHGPIPRGKEVCHRCNERRCCNPDHLFLGSRVENMADLKAKWRALRRIPLEAWPADMPAGDLEPIRIFIDGRELVGRVAPRPVSSGRRARG